VDDTQERQNLLSEAKPCIGKERCSATPLGLCFARAGTARRPRRNFGERCPFEAREAASGVARVRRSLQAKAKAKAGARRCSNRARGGALHLKRQGPSRTYSPPRGRDSNVRSRVNRSLIEHRDEVTASSTFACDYQLHVSLACRRRASACAFNRWPSRSSPTDESALSARERWASPSGQLCVKSSA
jgi:hypothetical protein